MATAPSATPVRLCDAAASRTFAFDDHPVDDDGASLPIEVSCRVRVHLHPRSPSAAAAPMRSPATSALTAPASIQSPLPTPVAAAHEHEEEKEPAVLSSQAIPPPSSARGTVHASAAQLLKENVRLRTKVEQGAKTIGQTQRPCARTGRSGLTSRESHFNVTDSASACLRVVR